MKHIFASKIKSNYMFNILVSLELKTDKYLPGLLNTYQNDGV